MFYTGVCAVKFMLPVDCFQAILNQDRWLKKVNSIKAMFVDCILEFIKDNLCKTLQQLTTC